MGGSEETLFNNFGLYLDDIFQNQDRGHTVEELALQHSSTEFRIRQLVSNWFCAFPYYEQLETVPVFAEQQYQTRNVHIDRGVGRCLQ
jgi:hypothetical protein